MSVAAIPICICADDFGIAPGVDRAIAELAGRGRLSAVSCLVDAPAWPRAAARLGDMPDTIELGLHLSLAGLPPRLGSYAARAWLRTIDRGRVATAVERQIDAFEAAAGRPPAFLDGHLHVHQFPVVRDVVAGIWRRRLPKTSWIRNTASSPAAAMGGKTARVRTLALAVLGSRARATWRRIGAATNAGFAGVRSFDERQPYRALMQGFLASPRPGLLVMCHPGVPDHELASVDPVTGPRAAEFDYLRGPEFEADLATAGVRLAPLRAMASR